MDNKLSDLTVIILTFKTDKSILINCLKSIDSNVKVIIVENSKTFVENSKKFLEISRTFLETSEKFLVSVSVRPSVCLSVSVSVSVSVCLYIRPVSVSISV